MSLADFFDRIGNNFATNFENGGGQGLASLGAAIASAPRNQWGAGIAQGLGQFRQIADQNKKKASLAEALKGMPDLNPLQRMLIENYPEAAVPQLAENVFKPKEKQGGPFAGTAFDASAANILVRGNQPGPDAEAIRGSTEYSIAYANMTQPKVITDAEGRQVLYRPEVPKGIAPPMSSQPTGFGPMSAPAQPAPRPGPVAPPMGRPTPPPANLKPDAPGTFFEPDMHPELYDPSKAAPSAPVVSAVPGGGTTTVIPGTGQKPGEGEVSGIRNQLNTVLPSMESALNGYEAALNDTSGFQRTLGPLGGAPTAKLKTLHTNALLQAKELFNLGVLNGPDYTLMTQMIDDPESATAMLRGKAGLLEQIKTFRSILKKKVEDYQARANSLNLQGIVTQPTSKTKKPDPLGIR